MGLQMRMIRIRLRTTMIVCLCHRISDRDIAQAVRAGCSSFDGLQDELRVATACGACGDCARETLAQHCRALAPAAAGAPRGTAAGPVGCEALAA